MKTLTLIIIVIIIAAMYRSEFKNIIKASERDNNK